MGGGVTGLGNPEPEIMDGKSTGSTELDTMINECAKDCYETFFKGTAMDYDACDAVADAFGIRFGIEPAYFGHNLRLITFMQNKERCNYKTGHAFGMYGSGIRAKIRYYGSYKNSSKFTKFIDKWHATLFEVAT